MSSSKTTIVHARIVPLLVAGFSLAVLAMHAYVGSFSRWMADDYCSAAEEKRLGILRAAWFWLRTWNGRYSANVLDAFFGYLGPAFTPAVTAIVLISWVITLTAAIHALARRTAAENVRLVWSLSAATAIIFLTLALAPNVAQSLYWAQGMREFIPALIILGAYVALFAWCGMRQWSAREAALLAALAFLLVYGAGGFSEMFTTLQLSAFGLAIIVWRTLARGRLNRAESLALASGALAAVLGFATMVLSPGNAGRQALMPAPPAIPQLLRISVDGFGLFLAGLAQFPIRLIALAGVLALGLWLGAMLSLPATNWRTSLLILALGALLTFSCFPPPAYGTSEPPFGRTLIIPTYAFVLTIFLFGVTLASAVARRERLVPLASGALVALVIVAALMAIHQMAGEQSTHAAYARAWERFHAEMVGYQQAGTASAQVWTADLNANNWAGLNVLGDNPKFWLNKCVSAYYGVSVTSNTP